MTRTESNYFELYLAEKKQTKKLEILLAEAEDTITRQNEQIERQYEKLKPMRENVWD